MRGAFVAKMNKASCCLMKGLWFLMILVAIDHFFPRIRYLNRQLWIRGRCCSWTCNGSFTFAKLLHSNSEFFCLCMFMSGCNSNTPILYSPRMGWHSGSPLEVGTFRIHMYPHVIVAMIKAGSWWIHWSWRGTEHPSFPSLFEANAY